ncbi:MAG TPA: thiamine pyrophosphate-dependent enzyme, partial [Rhodanobacteraceae bacterium]|nr:thiamine pyrophosphate-dependent enzyme [Rhodanobacteraceae bacterium]
EDHPLSLGLELGGTGAATLNALIDECDLVLVIGCKLSHNASRGFRLRLPEQKFIHVDASPQTLGANYPPRIALEADAGAFVDVLLDVLGPDATPAAGFDAADLDRVRSRGRAEASTEHVEPRIHGVPGASAESFFAALRRAMPREACLVTDSGLHQVLARRHFRVLHPRTFMTPTNLQSMGFAVGAAIGACVADPSRPVVALLGDGGFMMSGLELIVAVRERLRLTVIVFVDGAYGLIRAQQLETTGRVHGTEFEAPDIAGIAAAIGAGHARIEPGADAEAVLAAAVGSSGVTIVEVAVGDSLPMHWMRAKATARTLVRPVAKLLLRKLRRR